MSNNLQLNRLHKALTLPTAFAGTDTVAGATSSCRYQGTDSAAGSQSDRHRPHAVAEGGT